MSDCPNLIKCPFFNDALKNMPGTSEIYKHNYCRNKYFDCARYIFAKSGNKPVPSDLFPNEKNKILSLIN